MLSRQEKAGLARVMVEVAKGLLDLARKEKEPLYF